MSLLQRKILRPPDDRVHGTMFSPPSEATRGAAVVIGGSSGGEPMHFAEALAEEGIAALSLAYFGHPGLPPQLSAIPLEYFRDATRTLGRSIHSANVPVVMVGISRGTEAALLSAVYFSEHIRGVVASLPSNLAICSWPPGGPAWVVNGSAIPYASRFGPYSADPRAQIPVERIRGPILLVSAGADQVWPSAAMARAIANRLESRGHAWGHKVLEYPEASHVVGQLVPELPPGILPPNLVDQPPDRAARADAWPKVVDFIRRQVSIVY